LWYILREENNMIEINSVEQFEKEILKGKVLVDLYAPYCQPCKRMREEILPLFDQEIKILTVDASEIFEIASILGASSVPTIALYQDGVRVNQRMGFMDEDEVRGFIQ
jgi:thioredoxin 1